MIITQVDLIQKQSEVAGKEFSIETSLDAMELGWEPVVLQIEAYKETGTSVLRGIDEYMALLDEHITTTQAMSFSAFKGPFEERIDTWNETLNTVSEMLDEWIAVRTSASRTRIMLWVVSSSSLSRFGPRRWRLHETS